MSNAFLNGFLGQALLVGFGGFIGSSLRFSVSQLMHRLVPGGFPIGTLTVNMVGCLLIGLVIGAAEHRELLNHSWRLFLAVGLLGGFTTYSSFAFENLTLITSANFPHLILNIVIQLVVGLVFAWLGFELARLF